MQTMNDDSTTDINGQMVNSEVGELPSPQPDVVEEIDPEKEIIYQKAVNFMESLKCMAACKDKEKMYKRLASQFAGLSGYKDSEQLMKKCKRGAKKAKEAIGKSIYERALYHQNTAKSATDYKIAAAEYRNAAGYMDAEERAEQCDKLYNTKEKRAVIKIFINWGIAVLAFIALILIIVAPFSKYFAANLSMRVGHYNFAAVQYEKLGTYKDSEEKYLESRYQYGLKLEKEGSYQEAEKIFTKLNDYKDSSDRETKLGKLVISQSNAGDTVKIGGVNWTILDIQDSKALLLREKAEPGTAYSTSVGLATWENSDLRKYLNTDYLVTTFSEQERKNICLSVVTNTDNPVYATDAGADTQDYIFVLNTEEAKKYAKLLPTVKADTWLRTPGSTAQSAAFLSVDKAVMDYGYDVTSDKISVLPAMWYDFSVTE